MREALEVGIADNCRHFTTIADDRTTKLKTNGNRPKLGAMFLQHAIVFLFCVVFPGLVTMMAPASWLTFTRSESGVSCTTRTCVFFIVPYKTQQVAQVTGIDHRDRAGRTERQRKFGRTTTKKVHVDGEGFLQILGVGDQNAEVSVSPASLENVIAKANDFLTSTKEGSTTLFAIANWKFGGLMGGILTAFTILYVVGYTLGLLAFILAGIKKALGLTSH